MLVTSVDVDDIEVLSMLVRGGCVDTSAKDITECEYDSEEATRDASLKDDGKEEVGDSSLEDSVEETTDDVSVNDDRSNGVVSSVEPVVIDDDDF